jgi:hypothetical protein
VSAAPYHVLQLLLVKSQLTPSRSVRESAASVVVEIVICHEPAIHSGVGSPRLTLGDTWGKSYESWFWVNVTSARHIADTLSFALRHEGRKSRHDSDRLNADIVAKRLVRHLQRAGYVVMKKPPLGGHDQVA